MKKYSLITIDASELFKSYAPTLLDDKQNYGIGIDLTGEDLAFKKRQIISSVDPFPENALFYQMEKLLRDKAGSWTEDSLKQRILYIDFKKVFALFREKPHTDRESLNTTAFTPRKTSLQPHNTTIEEKLRLLFDKNSGLTITFEDGRKVRFVPFDKSSSMARDCRITFIDCSIKENLDKRLLLDLDKEFLDLAVNPSKFYAYRGLYMSDAHRINSASLVLDEKTVIVIPDDQNIKKDPVELFGDSEPEKTEKEKDLSQKLWQLGTHEVHDLKTNPFDGEGFISLEYSCLLNDALGEGYGYLKDSSGAKKDASSYQIRMPLTKGVLHAVNYHFFFNKYVDHAADEPLLIRDYFGIERDLGKAEIILTESMFKCCKWLKKIWKDIKKTEPSSKHDPMKYFFDKCKADAYDHSLYVGNTDLVLSDAAQTEMNYQFLSTLALDGEAFDSIVQDHLENADHVKENLVASVNAESVDIGATDNMAGDDLLKKRDPSPWLSALAKNDAFVNDPKISAILTKTEGSLLVKAGIGRLIVDGEIRFLSGDLLALLLYILKNTFISKKGSSRSIQKQDLKNGLEEMFENGKEKLVFNKEKPVTLFEDRFCLPGNRIALTEDNYYALLRNPHLSRNEQCILRPYIPEQHKGSLYQEFFSHLTGVIMVSRHSLVPMALSGADFDGDLVKIVADPRIINAIKKTVYTEVNHENKLRLARALPIIEIPDTKRFAVERQNVTDSVPFDTIKNTFSNQIGHISNMAITLGRIEASNDSVTTLGMNTNNENISTPACTVFTGLEIDAAKTGIHPSKNIEEIEKAIEDILGKQPDYFIEIKNKLTSIGGFKDYQITVEESSKNAGEYTIKAGNKKYVDITSGSTSANIDRLPDYYAKEKIRRGNRRNRSVAASSGSMPMFGFQLKDGRLSDEWRKELDKDKKQAVSDLIIAYNRILSFASDAYKTRSIFANADYIDFVIFILKIQYDSLDKPLPNCEPARSIRGAMYDAYAYLNDIIKSQKDAAAALQRLKESKWHLAPQKRRAIMAYEIITGKKAMDQNPFPEESAAAVQLISNFDCTGYKILYYMLKDIYCNYLSMASADDLSNYLEAAAKEKEAKKKREKSATPEEKKYFDEMHKKYNESEIKKESKKIWQPKLIEYCSKALFGESGILDDADEAIRYVFSLRNAADKSARFFWDVLPPSVINKNVYSGKYMEDGSNAE